MRCVPAILVSISLAALLSGPAFAGKKNAIAVDVYNDTNHGIGLEKEPTWDPKPSDWIFSPPTISSGSSGFFGSQTSEDWIGDRSFTFEVGGYNSAISNDDPYGQHESCEVTVKMYGVGNGFAGPGCSSQHPQVTAIFKNRTKYDLDCLAAERENSYDPANCTVLVDFLISQTKRSRF